LSISRYLFDDYILPFVRKTLSYFEKIYTFDSYRAMLAKSAEEKNLHSALPFCVHQIPDCSFESNAINVTGILRNISEAEVLATSLEHSFRSMSKYFLLAGKIVDEIPASVQFHNVGGYDSIRKLSDISKLSKFKPVLFTDEVFGSMAFMKYYVALKNGYASIITEESIRSSQNRTNVITEPFIPGYSKILGINVEGVSLGKLI